jgi:peptidyl-prolyl cis-trans isomerase SurA
MKRIFAILVTAVLLLGSSPLCAQTEQVIDRIIATVNKRPLLLSDWEASIRMEAFLQGRQPDTFSKDERRAVLNRLIDRELLLQQMQADYSPSEEAVKERIQSIRTQFGGADTDQGWLRILSENGLTPADVESFVRTQLQIMRFVDLRLRPTIRVEESALQAYYDDTLVPEVKKTGAEPEPFQQLRPKIREIIVQQRMEGVLETWLTNLRSQSEIHFASAPDTLTGAVVPGGGVDSKSNATGQK